MTDAFADKLRLSSLRAVKWSAFAEFLSVSVQPVVIIILARILSPTEFGVVAVATMIVGLAQLFQEFGLGKALIQADDYTKDYANNAFWLNIVLGIFCYLCIYLGAPALAVFFKSPESLAVIRVLSLQLVINACYSVHLAILQRDMNFRSIFIVRLITSLITGALSIAVALNGGGAWALVIGALATSVGQLLLYWFISPWRPKFDFDMSRVGKMVTFSQWVMLEAVLAWCITNGDSAALGHNLGAREMGMYRIATYVIMFVSYVFMSPVVPVCFSYLSRLQNDFDEFRHIFDRLTHILAALSLPVGFGIAILSGPIVSVVLGDKWAGADVVLAILAIRFGIDWVFGLSSTAFSALGRPKLNVILLFLSTFITVPAYLFAAPYGLVPLTLSRLITSLILNVIGYTALIRILKFKPTYFLKPMGIPLISVLIMTGSLLLVMKFIAVTNVILLTGAVLFGAAVYLGCLWLFARDFVVWGFGYLREILR